MKSLVVAVLLVAPSGCDSRFNAPKSVQLLEFGIFKKIASVNNVRESGAIAGERHAVSEVVLLEGTTNIPVRIGTSFGLRVMFPGKASNVVVPCTAKCLHPKLTDPSSGRSSELEQWDTSGWAGHDGYIGYTFDNNWELVPGQWTVQVFVDSKLVAEKAFNVYAAPKN